MQFIVVGTDRTTGQQRSELLEATDAAGAAQSASSRGLVVQDVQPYHPHPHYASAPGPPHPGGQLPHPRHVGYAGPMTGDHQTDATGGIIPYKNVPALVGYYVGIFSFVGLFLLILPGVLMGIAAIVLGIAGLVKRSRQPHVRGMAHAIVAIVTGFISLALGLLVGAALLAR